MGGRTGTLCDEEKGEYTVRKYQLDREFVLC